MNLGVYDITVDFAKLLVHNSTSIYFKEGDLNTAKVKAKLTMQRKSIDITGCNVVVKIETMKGEKIDDLATIVDATNGIVEIDFKSNALIKGTNFFELKIVKDESVKNSPKLAYRVLDSIDDTGSVEGTNEYPILIRLVSDVNIALNKANAMNTELTTAINEAKEVTNKTNNAKNEALEAVEDVKNAIAAGTKDLEVKRARGEYTELKDRLDNLDKDLLKAKNMTVISIVTENNFATVKDTVDGYFEDIKIEGKTLVNLIPNTKVLDRNGLNFTISVRFSELTNLKPNTKYYVKIFDPENKVQSFWAYTLSTSVTIVGVEGEFTSVSDLTQATSYLHVYPNEKFTQEDIDKIKVVMIEGEKQEIDRYFEGMKSVGDDVDEIVVTSVKGDGNLIDPNSLLINKSINPQGALSSDPGRVATGYIRVQENTQYYFKGTNYYPNAPTRSYYCFYDINKKLIDERDFFDNYIFTTPKGCAYVRLFTHSASEVIGTPLSSLENIKYELYKGTSKLENVHKSDKKKLLCYDTETQTWKKPILREWDRIEGNYFKKSGEIRLNGNEPGIVMDELTNTTRVVIPFPSDFKYINGAVNFMCDRYNCKSIGQMNSDDVVGDFAIYNNNKCYITLPKGTTLEQAKEILQSDNVAVVYELSQEKVYECTPIDLITYDNETNYMIESGPINPKTTLKCVSFIGNVINTLKEKVSYLEDKLYKTNLANFTVALNALDTKLRLEQLEKAPS